MNVGTEDDGEEYSEWEGISKSYYSNVLYKITNITIFRRFGR